jgi:tetratricopeptide (TPR) repeat protein
VYDLEGNTQEALSFLNKSLQLDPENAGILHVLAGAHEKLGDIDQAMLFYQESLKLDPNDEECLSGCIALWAEYSLIEPEAFLYDFLITYPTNITAKVCLVNVYWKLGKHFDAIALFKECVEQDKDKAKEIFTLNEELLNVNEFVNLAD